MYNVVRFSSERDRVLKYQDQVVLSRPQRLAPGEFVYIFIISIDLILEEQREVPNYDFFGQLTK